MRQYVFVFFVLAACLLAVSDVSAFDWSAKPAWVVRAEEKYQMEQSKEWTGHPSFMPRSTLPCVVKENSYDNGTVFYRVWGIEGHRSDGSVICYVPNNRRNSVKKSSVVAAPVLTDSDSCVTETVCRDVRDRVCGWERDRVCVPHHGCRFVSVWRCHFDTVNVCSEERVCGG